MYNKIRYFFYLVVLIALPFFITKGAGKPMIQKTQAPLLAHTIIDAQGNPTPVLLNLFRLVPPQGLDLHQAPSLKEIVAATQADWLRGADAQRWHVQEKITQNREAIIKNLHDIKLFEKIVPGKKIYSYCLILGSTASNVRKRLSYVLNLWQQGVRFEQLIFLGGDRPLDPEKETIGVLLDRTNLDLPIRSSWEQPLNLPTTETGAMQLVFSQAELPEGFENVAVTFINSPMKQRPDGTLTRPTTGDTIDLWLSTNPLPGSCLFISHQPYVGYQDSVVRTLMPKDFPVETVGNEGTETNISVLLDNIARWLYQENIRLQKKN